ncbi:MAG: peptide-methionine (R)-S-oxide reductase MsrB [Pyrinomonadaceae bacterium]
MKITIILGILVVAIGSSIAALVGCNSQAASPLAANDITPAAVEPAALVAADENAGPDSSDVLISAERAKKAPAISPGDWINSEPLTLEGLRGRVVYVEFWTFSCYNCVNTLPAVKGYDTKYRDKGLTVIGVQSPEFESEKSLGNVKKGVARLGVKYAVVNDNEMKTWDAYGVNAWPTIFILDKQGRIRYTHVGEGAYDMQDKVIQTLLAEGSSTKTAASNDELFDGQKIARSEAEWQKLLTPAQYLILREEGTDYPYKSQYNDNHEHGDYYCAACHLKLFNSETKFESGTGWPSFYQPINAKNVVEKTDDSLGSTRTEIECARCGSHLGHVFDDGPKPTGLRYCMNGTALKFERKS